MIFSIIILALVGIIAYFHWVQGMFSAVISAVCAIVAAMLAFAYHEQVAQMAFATKMTDQGHGITLALMFAILYLVLRVIFDSLVPGNVRFPAIIDKVGGAILGAIAGVFAVGTLAVAAQALPFGPDVGGYSRYAIGGTRDVQIPLAGGRGQRTDSEVHNELKSDKINEEDAQRMILPVDEIVVGMVRSLSDGGSLAGARPLSSVHGDYLDQMFFNRLGVQAGGRHVAINTDKQQQAKVEKVSVIEQQLAVIDGELPEIRNRKDLRPVKSDPANALLAVRVRFGSAAADDDRLIRMGIASVRLFASGTNYFPEWTLQGDKLVASRPDDFLFFNTDGAVDFVFRVPRNAVFAAAGPAAGAAAAASADAGKHRIKPGVFVEVKRMARTELTGVPVQEGLPEPAGGILRKPGMTAKDGSP
jgi:hypothetical protein